VDVLRVGREASKTISSAGGKGRTDPSGGRILYGLSECLPEYIILLALMMRI
jgi:hypothetical protein